MNRIVLLFLLALPVYGQGMWPFGGSGDAKSIRGKNVVSPLSCTDGQQITWVAANSRFECGSAGGAGSGYATIADEGSDLTARTKVNFTGSGVSCVDNSGSSRTDCTISGGGASAVTDLTDCKVTVAGATATVAACRYEYTASDGRNVTAAISGATWAISGGTESATTPPARFEIDPNGGSPIIRCIYPSTMTASNYTATGCTETAGEDFSVGTKPLATLALSSGAWSTLTDVRALLATQTVTAGTGLSKSGSIISLGTFALKTKVALPLVACSGTTGTLMWDTLASLAPTATCSAGSTNSDMMRGVADWPDSDGDYSVQIAFLMPDDWDTSSDLDAVILWRTTDTNTGHDAVFQVQTACRADAEVDDVAWNTASTVTDAAKGTTNQLNSAAITNITKTGCAAGELLHVRLLRNRTHASDTLAATLSVGHVELTARRSITQ